MCYEERYYAEWTERAARRRREEERREAARPDDRKPAPAASERPAPTERVTERETEIV